jgi:hypothetical protein
MNSKSLNILENLLGEQCEHQKVEISFRNAVYYKKTTRKNTNFMSVNGICKKCNGSNTYVKRLQADINEETVDANGTSKQPELAKEGELAGEEDLALEEELPDELDRLFQMLESFDDLTPNKQQKLVERLAKTEYRNYYFTMESEPNLENTVNNYFIFKCIFH